MSAHVSDFRHRQMLKCGTLTVMLQLILVLNTNLCATASPEMGANLDPEMASPNDALMLGYDEAKRSWQSLQGAWGKRTPGGGDAAVWSAESSPVETDADAVFLAEHWMPMLLSGGGGGNGDGDLKYSLVYLTNANAATLDRLANRQQLQSDEVAAAAARFNYGDPLSATSLESDSDGNIPNDKRAWKNLNGAWGKRRNAPAWNKFRGAWGKREPGWNNLKGMWGKRSSKDWQKLHHGWGKRSNMN